MPYSDKEKQREYQRRWLANRRTKWIESNGPCAKCGSTEQLEVDHIDRSTKHPKLIELGTGGMWSWSKERLTEELAKCQVLCNDCHKKKTRSEVLAGHGLTKYDLYGCRCEVCKEAKRIKNAKRYAP